MIEEHTNMFDMCVIGVMALSCLFAFFRGLVKEILSLAAWIGAGIVTIYYFPLVAEKLQPHFKSGTLIMLMSTVGLYVAALVVFAIINMIILKTIKGGGGGGMLDNLLGLVFGAVRGALIISLGFFLMSHALPPKDSKDYPEWLKESKTRPYAEQGAAVLAAAAPKYLEEVKKLERQSEKPSSNNDYGREVHIEEDDNSGYSRTTQRNLDRLMGGTDKDE